MSLFDVVFQNISIEEGEGHFHNAALLSANQAFADQALPVGIKLICCQIELFADLADPAGHCAMPYITILSFCDSSDHSFR